MSIQFASNISALRRERNITQKAAAEELGISQALLSHYEKGIRECNLDFVIKAAEYYDVTTDYLLGLSKSRHGSNEIFESTPMKSDSQIISKTVLRAFLQIQQIAEEKGEEYQFYLNNYFSLSIKRFISSMCDRDKTLEDMCSIAQDTKNAPESNDFFRNEENEDIKAECIKTVEDHAVKLIKSKLEDAVK